MSDEKLQAKLDEIHPAVEVLIKVLNDPSKKNDGSFQATVARCLTICFLQYYAQVAGAIESKERTAAIAVSESAWLARGLVELTVWLKYASLSEEHSTRVFQDCIIDFEEIIVALAKMTPDDTERIDKEVSNMTKIVQQQRNNAPTLPTKGHLNVGDMAKELGLQPDFGVLNRIFSKLVHPSSLCIAITLVADKWPSLRNMNLLKALQASEEFVAGATGYYRSRGLL